MTQFGQSMSSRSGSFPQAGSSPPNTRSSEPSLGAATIQSFRPNSSIAGRVAIYFQMTHPEFTPDETATLINYARRKFAEERYPLSPELRAGTGGTGQP